VAARAGWILAEGNRFRSRPAWSEQNRCSPSGDDARWWSSSHSAPIAFVRQTNRFKRNVPTDKRYNTHTHTGDTFKSETKINYRDSTVLRLAFLFHQPYLGRCSLTFRTSYHSPNLTCVHALPHPPAQTVRLRLFSFSPQNSLPNPSSTHTHTHTHLAAFDSRRIPSNCLGQHHCLPTNVYTTLTVKLPSILIKLSVRLFNYPYIFRHDYATHTATINYVHVESAVYIICTRARVSFRPRRRYTLFANVELYAKLLRTFKSNKIHTNLFRKTKKNVRTEYRD